MPVGTRYYYYARHGNARCKRALLRFGGDRAGTPGPSQQPACYLCLGSDPPPIQSGCACRSDTGLAHVACLIDKAVAQQRHRGAAVWWECQTCGQQYTGATRRALAEAWWARVRDEHERNEERLCAAHTLAVAREADGQYAESERINREVLAVRRRVLGDEHPDTLSSAGLLATLLSR